MEDRKLFRDAFNFFTKYRDLIGHTDRNTFWASAAEEMGALCTALDNTEFAMDIFIAVYKELERREH